MNLCYDEFFDDLLTSSRFCLQGEYWSFWDIQEDYIHGIHSPLFDFGVGASILKGII